MTDSATGIVAGTEFFRLPFDDDGNEPEDAALSFLARDEIEGRSGSPNDVLASSSTRESTKGSWFSS